ncbi:hypothetical protein [Anaerococcus cruorum]|uniref:hypothetical protein n=1 Tax=Anaerococcus sp. WGS1596 TaxID=3366806 RepID=UPI00372D2B8D
MNKLVKYDLKANSRFIKNILILQIILVGLSFLGHGLLRTNYLTNPVFANGIFTIAILFFVIINLIYIIKLLSKDFKKGTILRFSLPHALNKSIGAKIINLALFYIVNMVLLFIFLWALKYKISSDIIYFLVLGLIWLLICANLVYFFMQINRFRQEKSYKAYGFLIILAIFGLGFISCKYFSFVLVNGAIQHAGPMNYAFVFPFAVGAMDLYKNITPLVYYFIILLVVIFVNKKNMQENIDLS